MPWPFEEYTLFENILGMALLYLAILLGYLIINRLLFQERRSGIESENLIQKRVENYGKRNLRLGFEKNLT